MPHPDTLPDVFLDRSLGRVQVPRLLRTAGLRVTTLAERYGVPADERIADFMWLADAGTAGEAVFMKDTRVRYNVAEQSAVRFHSVRCFCLARQDLPAATMASWFLANLPAIAAAATESGPFIYAVHEQRIVRLRLLGAG